MCCCMMGEEVVVMVTAASLLCNSLQHAEGLRCVVRSVSTHSRTSELLLTVVLPQILCVQIFKYLYLYLLGMFRICNIDAIYSFWQGAYEAADTGG